MRRCWLVALLLLGGCSQAPQVRVGSKAFTEGVILGELLTQLAHSAGVRAAHRSQLGGTRIVWQALLTGEIDVYAEYTGTIAEEILTDRNLRDEDAIRRALAERGIRMSRPLGFNNTYAIGMREDVAERLGVHTISDLRQHPDLRLGFTNEFMQRGDGWPSLRDRYRLPQKNVRGLEHSLAYAALDQGALDATDLYSTDAKIRQHRLRVLHDDLSHFPRYRAVLLYRADLEERHPEVVKALLRLEGQISEDSMIRLNARAEGERLEESRVAADYLAEAFGVRAEADEESAVRSLLRHAGQHLLLVSVSLVAAIAVAVPLGILAARRPASGHILLGAAGLIQTVPSLALLVFMLPLFTWLLGRAPALRGAGAEALGAAPAILALFLYSLLPIMRNTYAGLHGIPGQLRESAEALGLPPLARLRLVELPLAARTILAGVKTAAVINVGYATLGALIGAGGFGEPIITGLRRDDKSVIIWQGAVPAAVMALAVQGLFELVERFCVPKGLRLKSDN